MWAPPVGPRLAYGLGPSLRRTACSRSESPTSPAEPRARRLPRALRRHRLEPGRRSTSPGAAASAPVSTSRSAGRRPASRAARSAIRGTTRSPTRSGTRSSSATAPSSRRTAASRTRSSGSTARSRSSSTGSGSSAGTEARSRATTELTPSFQGITPIFSNDNCAALFPLTPGRPAHRPRLPARRHQPFVRRRHGRLVARREVGRRPRTASRSSSTASSGRVARSRGRSAPRRWPGGRTRRFRQSEAGRTRYLRDDETRPPLRRSARRARRLGLRRQRTEP